MIEEQARVIAVDADAAWVETHRRTVCDTCAINKGCGTGALSKVLGTKTPQLRVINDIGAQVGEQVVIGIEENALVRGSLAAYAAPLGFMIGAAALTELAAGYLGLSAPDGLITVAGAGGLGGGFWWLSRHNARISLDPRYQPLILRRAEAVWGAGVI